MQKLFIDKLAFIDIQNRKVLSTLSKGKDTWYIPGGKREEGETDAQALIREVKEELSIDIDPHSIKRFGVFEAQAHGKSEGTIVRMTCFTGKFKGALQASSEIGEFKYVNYFWKEKSSPVDKLIFDDLKNKGLIS
jgi:8-oxo-dGTP pyrophosphatase MutT (NUDIX family)